MGTLLDDEVISSKCFFPRKPPTNDETVYDIVDCGGLKLYCHSFVHPRSIWDMVTRKRAKTILFFHGNGEIVADYVGGRFHTGLADAGFNIFCAEYRGYGLSEGKPGYTTLFEDLKYLHDHLTNSLGVLENEIVCFGRSMGGLYATEFALKYPGIKALVLECTFADPTMLIYKRIAADPSLKEMFSLEKIQEEAKKHASNAEKLKTINPSMPVLILHAADDNLIEKTHAEENYAGCASVKKKLVMYPIGQHNFFHAANHLPYEMEGVKYRSIYEEVAEIANQ
eukprot:Phypoly_transcript_09895.p1 GENE.Phypoly_transcript_09895~~Phypoly_transcript_09895.p1  ORF type:complete len:282 (+),score=48.49 Phypoly_transcript_09895:131-976(+)